MKQASAIFVLIVLIFGLTGGQIISELEICVAAGHQVAPQISASNECFYTVWEDYRAGMSNANIYGQSIYPDGTISGPGFPVCVVAGSNQTSPALTYNHISNIFFSLWFDQRSGTDIYARNNSCLGPSGDEREITVVTANISSPEVAFSGTHYLYVWGYRSGSSFATKYMVLDAGGTLVGSVNELAGLGSKGPSVAFDGYDFLVVFRDSTAYATGIFGKYFSASGAPLGDEFLIIDNANASEPCVCGIMGTTPAEAGFAVVWQQNDGDESASNIYIAILEHLSTSVETGIPVCTAVGAQASPAISWHGHGFCVVWEDQRGGFNSDIYGRFLGMTGMPSGDDFVICNADLGQQAPRLAYIASEEAYFCEWTDSRNGNSDIYGALFSPPPATPGPTVMSVRPRPGAFSGCDSAMTISLSSEYPLDEATLTITLNGMEYTAEDTEIAIVGMNILFFPAYPMGYAETMNVCLNDIADEMGTHISEPYCWSWIWDDVPPRITSTIPRADSILEEIPTMVSAAISDVGAGINEATFQITVNGAEFTFPHFGIYWDGYTLTLNLMELGFSALPETNCVIFRVSDAAYCQNVMLDTLRFFVVSGTGPIANPLYPHNGAISSCPNQQIRIVIFDEDGIDETSIVLVVNGIEYSYPDHLSFIPPGTLVFTPSPNFAEGLVYVILNEANDLLGNGLAMPLSYSFYIDLTPPYIDSTNCPGGHELDSLSTEDLFVSAGENYCDSLIFNDCYVLLSNSVGGFVARWDGDSLIRMGPFSFRTPTGEFINALAHAWSPGNDSFSICVHIGDAPDYCYPNFTDTCWTIIFHGSDITETRINTAINIIASPNPFNSTVSIDYVAPDGGKIEILDEAGHVLFRHRVFGKASFVWDGYDEEGMPLPSGVYIVKLTCGSHSIVRTINLIR